MRRAMKDDDPASEVAGVETDSAATPQESRKRVIDAVNKRSTTPESAQQVNAP